MDPPKPLRRYDVTNCLDHRGVPSFRPEQSQESIHRQSSHEPHHSSHHRTPADCRARRLHRESEGKTQFHDVSEGDRRMERNEGDLGENNFIVSSSALRQYSSEGQPVPYRDSVNHTSGNQYKDKEEGEERRWRSMSVRTGRARGVRLISHDSGKRNVLSDDRRETVAKENKMEGERVSRVTPLKYCKPLLVVVLLLLVFGAVQLISAKVHANQPSLLHREGVFSTHWWSRWATPPFFFLRRGNSSIAMDHSKEFDDKKCDKAWWHPSAVVSCFLYSHRNSTNMESFHWRHFMRLTTFSSMWRKPVAAVLRCGRSFDSLRSTLLRPLLQAVRKGKLLVQLVIFRSHQLVQVVVQACWTCVRSVTFLAKKSRALSFSESANREKQRVIQNTSFIAGIVSHDESNTCGVRLDNLVNEEENVFPLNASSSSRRDTLYSASRLHQGMSFCYSMLRSIHAKWRSFVWRMFRIVKRSVQLFSTCKQWVMRGVGAALDRLPLVFRMMPASSPGSGTFTPLTESSTSMSSSNSSSSASQSRAVKWWRWRITERLSFAFPQRMGRYIFKTANHCIRTRFWWCWSNVLLAWRTISRSVKQTLFSFWNLIKIRQELMISMKRKQKFKQNPKHFLNEANTSSGTFSFSNVSRTSLDSHALHSQRRSKHLSSSVPSQLFYFVGLQDLHGPQTNKEKNSMTRKGANSECSECSLPEPSLVQQEIVRDLSLPSANFIKNLVIEAGVFIHFSRPEFGSFRNAAETANGSRSASRVPSPAPNPEVNCSASPSSSHSRLVQSAAPLSFFRLSPSKRLVEVLRTRKREYGAVKSGVNKSEGVLDHRKKEEMKVPDAAPLRCPSYENETTWGEQRKTLIAASAKCESEKEVLLQEKEARLQEWSERSKKAKDSAEAALRLEADEHAKHLQVTFAQECNARLNALNASFQAARNKTIASLCDARPTPSNSVGRWMRNVAVKDTSAAPIKQTEEPVRSAHPPKEKTRKRLSVYKSLLRHFSVRSTSTLPSNSSMVERLVGVPTTVVLENAKREVMLGVQEAIESRCSAECLTAAETSSGNDEQNPPHVRPPQCAEEATALHLRLTAQLENIFPHYSSPLRKTSPSSWSQVTSTLLLPQSLGNFCTFIWSGGIQDRHKWGQDVVHHKNLPVLYTASTRWYHVFYEHVRKMFFRIVWLTVVVGVLCFARGLYFLLEDNARLRCELQQATITTIQERMMHMEWRDDAQNVPPLPKGDRRSPLSYAPEATYPSKADGVTSSRDSKDEETKSAASFERDDILRASFFYFSSCLEMLFSSLSESHFHQCELLWRMEKEAPSRKVLHYLTPEKKKSISESSGTVLEGKSVLSSCQALVYPLTVSPKNKMLCGTNETNEGVTHLLEVLLTGYFKAVEEHYLDLLHASIPPAFSNRSDCVTQTVDTLMDDNVSANIRSCVTRRSKTPEKEGVGGGSENEDTHSDPYPNSENATACRRLSKVELERSNHHSEPRQSFCCLKWKLEAENAKNLMEMQAQTIKQLEEQLAEQLETLHTFPSTTTSVTQ